LWKFRFGDRFDLDVGEGPVAVNLSGYVIEPVVSL
jgi:hypothetical protein